MNNFPTHPIELNKMFKQTKFYIVNNEIEQGVYLIKIHVSKIKSNKDLQNAFSKVEQCAKKNGFNIELKQTIENFSDFRFHGSYYEIYFKVI